MLALYNSENRLVGLLREQVIFEPDTQTVLAIILGNYVYNPEGTFCAKYFNGVLRNPKGCILAKSKELEIDPASLALDDSGLWDIIAKIKFEFNHRIDESNIWHITELHDFFNHPYYLPSIKKKYMNNTTNALNWFEIPVLDLERATRFYEIIFDIEMVKLPEMAEAKMSGFPGEPGNGKVSGALAVSEQHDPSTAGVIIYLNANPDIQSVLNRIKEAGGEILMGKTLISPEIGYMAFFLDTENNKIGLHANN